MKEFTFFYQHFMSSLEHQNQLHLSAAELPFRGYWRVLQILPLCGWKECQGRLSSHSLASAPEKQDDNILHP